MHRWCASICQSKRQCLVNYGILLWINFTLFRAERKQPIPRKVTISGYKKKKKKKCNKEKQARFKTLRLTARAKMTFLRPCMLEPISEISFHSSLTCGIQSANIASSNSHHLIAIQMSSHVYTMISTST